MNGGVSGRTSLLHLTQGAAIVAEGSYILARELLTRDGSLDERLMRYSQPPYARCAFVYTFSYQWILDEQSVRTHADLAAVRIDLTQNASKRITASDHILNRRIF